MTKANQTTEYKVQLRNPRALNTLFTKTFLSLVAVLLLAPFNFMAPAFGQTEPPPPNMNNGPGDPGAGALSPGAQNTDPTAQQFPDEPPTNLVIQAAEQNKDTVITEVDELLTDNFRAYNDTYQGLHTFWGDDIISNLFANIGQLIGKWLTEFINGWVSDTVQFLTGFLRVFVLNPNIAINGLNGNAADDISPYIRQAADVMYGIAVDLLLLLFILCIWKFWAEAAWRGGGNLMGAVGRLIFTSGLMLAWPTIYAFEIQITNEMIRTLYFNSADQVSALDAAMAAAVKGGLLAGAGLIANATAPIAGQAFGGILGAGPGGLVLGTVGSLVAFVGLIIYLVLGGILIAQLVYILVLKAIQTALLTAQYMFAPIFLVFFATPDTENVTSGFVRSFVEVSLWTFVWVGMLKIMVIMILSDFNPWGKIILAVGILQLMIQVPAFLARAQISPMSDFISAGLITGGLMKAGHALSDTLGKRGMQLAKAIGGDFTTGAARGGEMSKKVGLNGLAHGVRDPKLLNEMRQAQKGEHPSQLKTGKDGKGGDGKTPLDANGKPIKPAGGPGAAIPGQPPKGKDKDKDKKKEGEVNPAAAAAAAGKDLNTAKKPGEAGGLDAGTAGKTAADALKKGLVGAGVAGGVGAGLAAMQGAKQGIGGNGSGGSDEEAKRAREAAEQAGMEAKNLANQINNGGLDDKDKDKNEPPTKTKLVEGKELKGTDAGKPGDKQAKIGLPGSGADLNSALGKGDGTKVDPTKGTGAKDPTGKDITQAVDRNLKPAGPGDKKEAGPGSKAVTDAKDLGAGGKDGKLDNGTGVPTGDDGKPLSMDVEDESANKVGLGLPPGVKLTPGAVTGGDKDKNAQPPAKGVDSKDLGTGKTGKDGAAAAAAGGPTLVGLKKPGANNQNASTKNSSDPVLAGLATATSVPTTGKNIDPTTALGDDTATDDKGVVPEGTNLPKPLKPATGSDKGAAVAGDGASKDVASGGTGGGKQQPPVKTPGPQTVQIETSEKGGVNLVLPGVAVAATQKGIAGPGAGEQRIDSKTGDVVDASGQGQGLQQPTELKSAGAVVPPGKLDTASGSNQADLKTDVQAGGPGAQKGQQGTVTQNVQVDSVGTTTPGVAVGLNLPGAKAIIPGAKIGDGLKLDARTPGGDPSVSPTGLDQNNQQTELKPGAGTVTGKIDGTNAGPNQADLKTEVTGGPTLKPPGSTGTVTQNVQVDGTNTATGQVPLNMPGARVNAKTNLQGQQLNADGGQVDADAEGVVTGNLGVPNVQGIVGKTQLDVGSVRPDGTAQATQGTGRVDVQQINKPVQSAAASVTPLQAVATAGLRNRAQAAVPGMQQMFDDGDEGGGEGGGGGGGNKPPGGPPTGGPWEPPDDRPAHGVAPPSPFEKRLNATGAARPIDSYQQAYYRWIPPRGISGAIRLAQGVTLGPSGHGGAELIGDTKGNTMHVRTGENMDQDQMALQMMTAGYATLLGSDPHAYDAARASAISAGEDQPKGWAQRMAAGIFAYNGGSWSQTANAKNNFQRSMYQHAVEGSQAYVNGQPGNEYTEYLSQRYGTMSDKQQAFGVHLMTDPSSPESSWHWAHVPATETLVKNSIPINATARAVAANPNIFRARPWEQRAAITGGIQYMEARKAQEIPDADPMVADAWVGREAQLLAPAVVNTITSLTSELGEDACWDVAKVNNVATQVGAGKDQSEYVSAYRALANVQERISSFGSRTSSPPSPPTAGGGTGVVRGPSGGGGGFGGGATTSVSGTIIGGGGGSAGGAATVDQVVEVEPGQQGAANVPPPNLSGLNPPVNPGGGGQQIQTNIVWQAKPGFTPPSTVQGNGPIRMTANTPPAQLGQHTINQSSGNLSAPPMQPITNEQVVEVEVVGTRMQSVPRVDPSQIKVPDVNAPTQEVKTNVDFQVTGGRDSGGISGGTDRMSIDATTNGTRVTSSTVNIGNAPTSASSNDITRNVRGEIQHRRSEYGSLNPDHLNSNVANLVNQFKDPAEAAFHIVYDLHASGFSFDQIADDKIATTAIAVRAQDPSMMRTAAIAANALGADNFTVERTHVVQAMMDSDPRWSDHNIDDKSIYAAEAIVRVHDNYQQEMTSSDPGHPMGGIKAYPTKDFVDRVVMHPEFKPRPVSSSSGYNESVVNKIVERFKDRIAGRDPNYGGIYDNRGSGQPA